MICFSKDVDIDLFLDFKQIFVNMTHSFLKINIQGVYINSHQEVRAF